MVASQTNEEVLIPENQKVDNSNTTTTTTTTLNILDRPDRVPELNDFLWTMKDEPHASRRHLLIKEFGNEIRDCMGYEWRTKYIVVILLGIQLYLAYVFREDALWGGTPLFYLTSYFIGAPIVQALFLAIHEISHNLAFKKYSHNKLFGIFANIPMVLPFFVAFKFYHQEHHKYQGIDGVDTDLPTQLEARLLSNRIGKLFFMFNQTWFYAFRPLFVRPQPFTPWHALNGFVQVAFIAITVQLFGWGPILYLLLCAHFSGGWHPLASHFIAEHYVFTEGIETSSYYGWMNKLTWNVGYHNEHHDFPTVPWTKLPTLSEIGKYKETLPYHESWVRVLWTFVVDDHVGFFNRVKRHPKANEVNEHNATADYNEPEWSK
jgi:sphingolipid delta-4 desaturase